MSKKMVKLAMANVGEQLMELEIVEKWEPEKITFLGNTVFFSVDGTFFSMNRVDFMNIFNDFCTKIK